MSCIVTASAAVVGARPAVRTRLNTRSGAVVMSGGWTNSVTRYSLNTMMNESMSPALTPGPMSGNTIRQNVCQRVAPEAGRRLLEHDRQVLERDHDRRQHQRERARPPSPARGPRPSRQVVGEVVDEHERDADDRAGYVQRQGQRREEQALAGERVAHDRVGGRQRDEQVDEQRQAGDLEAPPEVLAEAAEDVLEVLDGVRPARSGDGVRQQRQERQDEDDQHEPDVGVAAQVDEAATGHTARALSRRGRRPPDRCRRRSRGGHSTSAPRE